VKDLLVLLGRHVHELRMAKKWSQEVFADVSGLHRTYIGQIERGEKNLSFGNLVKISTVLGVTPSELLSVLDGDALKDKSEPTEKAGQSGAAQPARRVREIQRTLKRLKHQRDAMDQTMAVLEELAANPAPSRTKMKQAARKK
jgi:transcriptional regulator with XRE-family HTH domain